MKWQEGTSADGVFDQWFDGWFDGWFDDGTST